MRLNARFLNECRQSQCQVVFRGDGPQIPERSVTLLWLEIIDDSLFKVIDGVDEILFPGDPAAHLKIAKGEIDEDEHDVDERDRRLIEIVVVARDELANFVDERSESDSAEERSHQPGSVAKEGKADEQRRRHQQTSPKHVGNVKSRPAQTWIAGNSEDESDRQYGRHSANDEQIEIPPSNEIAGKGGVRGRHLSPRPDVVRPIDVRKRV